MAIHSDLPLPHALQQSRLGARRRPVEFVGQQDTRAGRAGHKLETCALLIVYRYAGHIVRQQVGRTLQTLETDPQGYSQGARQHRLACARHVLDQHVSLAQQGGQQQLDGLPLADDDLLDVGRDLFSKRTNGVQANFLSG